MMCTVTMESDEGMLSEGAAVGCISTDGMAEFNYSLEAYIHIKMRLIFRW